MEDRVSLYPGRVTLTPVEGQPNTYDMVRADQPTQQGTALSKANLLKDTTAAQFGLGSEAVPDDVLSWVGKYAEHWWERGHNGGYKLNLGSVETVRVVGYSGMGDSNPTIQYATSVTVSSTGIVSLDNPVTINARGSAPSILKGKYFTGGGGDLASELSAIYYASASANAVESQANAAVYWDVDASKVTTTASVEPYTDFVHSTDRNACPDSGTVDGITYTYLGCPFEKLPGAVQIAMGSYMGTGVYGSNNANKLTFDFAPKLLMVRKDGYSYGSAVQTTNNPFYCIIMDLMTAQITDDFSSTVAYNAPISVNTANSIVNAVDTYSIYVKKSTDEKTIAWKGANVNLQMNTANIKYYYVALG